MKIIAYLYKNHSYNRFFFNQSYKSNIIKSFIELILFEYSFDEYIIKLISPISKKRKIKINSDCVSIYFYDNLLRNIKFKNIEVEITKEQRSKKYIIPIRIPKSIDIISESILINSF